jgi:hypothetical protein
MTGTPPDDPNHLSSGTASITVLAVKPVKFGRIFALASVEIGLDGVLLLIHGVRAIRAQATGTRIDLPVYRDENFPGKSALPAVSPDSEKPEHC